MAVRDVEFVIVGGGVAAAKAAEGVRAAGGEGPAVVLTAEPELPYERPPLSKAFLRGEAGRDYVRTHDGAWYRDTRSSCCWRPGRAPSTRRPGRSPPRSATSSATAPAWCWPPAPSGPP
jgi:hypothetical protein